MTNRRTIIQVISHHDKMVADHPHLIALADDGTLWQGFSLNHGAWNWRIIPDVPQEAVPATKSKQTDEFDWDVSFKGVVL
jgi:hypothetical protein